MMIRAAVVGCGNFACAIHLPNIVKNPAYELRAVVDNQIEAAEKAASEFGAAYATSDYGRVLNDEKVDLVIICTPHNSHAELSLQAVHAGKHVLVEKPMALKLEEIPPLLSAVRSAGVILSVGFNRRYAPLMHKARELAKGRTYPMVINYRIVDEIWHHPWALDPHIGGGRILSESVHIFDLCSFLIGCEPTRIYAEGGALSHPDTPDTQDNAVMVLRYEDGSIVSITHGDLGNAAYPKERAEMFLGHKTIVVDNYQQMEAVGFGEPIHIECDTVEKGFVEELNELAKAITFGHSDNLASEIDGARATLCAVKAIEAITTGAVQPLDLSFVERPSLA